MSKLSSRDSATATELLSGISVGSVSVQYAQKLAKCVEDDMQRLGCTPPQAIQGLARLGNCGRSPQNCERDLHRWLQLDRKRRNFDLVRPTVATGAEKHDKNTKH